MRDFHRPGRSVVYAQEAMVATSMPAASLVAVDMLRRGGNAMDAALAAIALLGVMEPQSTGIGGDCFCLYLPSGGTITALNGSGRAPARTDAMRLYDAGLRTIPESSPHAVTIPGAVAAWQALSNRFGQLGLPAVLQPAIAAAENGWIVAPRVAKDWLDAEPKLSVTGATGLLPGGRPPVAGSRFLLPGLAATLRRIAAKGAAGFYEDEVATDLVATLRRLGGCHSEADFANGLHGPDFVEPIQVSYGGHEVWQCPPNGVGLATLMILGLLKRQPLDPSGPLGVLRLHRLVENARLVFRDRDAFFGDPDSMKHHVGRLLDGAYLDRLASLVDDSHTLSPLPDTAIMIPAHRDTAYVAVVDRDGNACSLINSLYDDFGGGLVSEQSGVIFHNRGCGFVLTPDHPNALRPGARPMHTIIPCIVTRAGRPVLVFAVTGGHFQPIGQSLILSGIFDYDCDIQEALDMPRVFPFRGTLGLEGGVSVALEAALQARGHDVRRPLRPFGGGQAILIDHARSVLVGASDFRRDGIALGY